MTADDPKALWEQVSGPLRDQPQVAGSTMMGLPCLRVAGAFFAAWEPRTGDLLVKLPSARVDALLEAGAAQPFAPAGRRFRAWAAVPAAEATSWPALADEALRHVRDTTGPASDGAP